VGRSHRIARRWAAAAAAAAVACLAPIAAADRPEALLLLGSDPSAGDRIVSQDEWAAALAESLGIAGPLPVDHGAGDLFTLLCSDRAELALEAGRRVPARTALRASAELPPARSPREPRRAVVSLPAAALYQIAVEGVGAQRWSVDGQALGHVDPSGIGVGHVPVVVPLAAGPHELAATLAPQSRVERVEVSAYRALCIAPSEGWRAGHPLSFGAKARTLVQAMGFEGRLPLVGDAIPIEGEGFVAASGTGGLTNRRLALPASADGWATAASSPAEFSYRVRLDEPGLYTLLARLHGREPQLWSVDGRYQLTLKPGEDADAFAWTHVFTLPLSAGEHVIRALLPRGAGIDVLRLQARAASDSDYLALLDSLGFREGAPDQLVTWSAAHANLSHPTFVARADGFLARIAEALGTPGDLLAIVARELEQLYSRPLSPCLPPEL
jgi:hypothetical protein